MVSKFFLALTEHWASLVDVVNINDLKCRCRVLYVFKWYKNRLCSFQLILVYSLIFSFIYVIVLFLLKHDKACSGFYFLNMCFKLFHITMYIIFETIVLDTDIVSHLVFINMWLFIITLHEVRMNTWQLRISFVVWASFFCYLGMRNCEI